MGLLGSLLPRMVLLQTTLPLRISHFKTCHKLSKELPSLSLHWYALSKLVKTRPFLATIFQGFLRSQIWSVDKTNT